MFDVLLVDDEPIALNALEKNVDWKKCGIRKIFKAGNMEDAKELLKNNRLDIVISDIEMPNGSGMDLLEWIRDEKIRTNCIFLTCHNEFDFMRKAIQLKCYDFMLKPVRYPELEQMLTELVHKLEAWEGGDENADDVNWGRMNSGMRQQQKSLEDTGGIEREVKRYIREHVADNISIQDIADALHFNPQYLMRSFKSVTGMSIFEYLTHSRMEAAKKILLNTKMPIKDVASLVGYDNYVYFTQVFRKVTGVTPSQFRISGGT